MLTHDNNIGRCDIDTGDRWCLGTERNIISIAFMLFDVIMTAC